jgi:hypothetical protein
VLWYIRESVRQYRVARILEAAMLPSNQLSTVICLVPTLKNENSVLTAMRLRTLVPINVSNSLEI